MRSWRRIGLSVAIGIVAAFAILCSFVAWRVMRTWQVHRAAQEGDLQALKTAIERYPDEINIPVSNPRGGLGYLAMPALMWAVKGGNPKAVEVLLVHGADLESVDRPGRTALCLAVHDNKLEIAEILLKAGANPDVLKTGWAPLFLALSNGNVEQAKLLIDSGADLGIVFMSKSALSTAVYSGKVESVRFLVERGLKARDSIEQRMLVDHAERYDKETAAAILELLKQTDPNP